MLSEPLAEPAARRPFGAAARLECRPAGSTQEVAEHRAIRHQIFVDEQAVFAGSDWDLHDEQDAAIALLAFCDGRVAGTVRLFPLDPSGRVWQGDRLAVLRAYRIRGVGAPLVRCAVATAGARGGRSMVAHIQPANVTFFERLGWARSGPTEIYAGLPHQPMGIELPGPVEGVATLRMLAGGASD